MLTTKRSNGNSYFSNERSGCGVDLLERRVPDTYAQFVGQEQEQEVEDLAAAKERMQKNLEFIMNYDKPENIAPVENLVQEECERSTQELSIDEDDIKPSSTTLQFGEENIDQMYIDMSKVEKATNTAKRLSTKSKVVIALYSVAVAVMLALIVINTGILAMIRSENLAKTQLLNTKAQQYMSITNEIESISSNDHVINLAENDFGMIKGN